VFCKLCEQGRFNHLTKKTACTKCTPGEYQPNEQQTKCLLCHVGKFAADSQATTCASCASGFFAMDPGQPKCTPCKPGTFYSGTQVKGCTACDLGRYSSEYNSTTCKVCGKDRYKSPSGASKCGGCLAGKFLDPTTNECAGCPAGTFNGAQESEASSCTKCQAGTFTKDQGSTACTNCAFYLLGPLMPEDRSSCAPVYKSWVVVGGGGGLVLIVAIIGICCIKRNQANAAEKRAKLSHRLLTLRDYDSNDAPGRGSLAEGMGGLSSDDEDGTQDTQDEWERRENLGETWFYNKRTHAATLDRPDGFQSDEGNDNIPDAPSDEDTTATDDRATTTTEPRVVTISMKYDFAAAADDTQQISASKSDVLTVVQKFDDGWWKVRDVQNNEGLVPASYCTVITETDDDTGDW